MVTDGPSKICLKSKLSILIIGPQVFLKKLSAPLKSLADAKFKMPTSISTAELVQDVTEKTDYSFFDSIIMVVDTAKDKFSEEVTKALARISPQQLVRLLLVNGSSGSCNFVSSLEFKGIADRFNMNYLSAEIKDPESCSHLLERLIGLIDLTFGISSGRPVPIPTAKVLSNISQHYYSQENH